MIEERLILRAFSERDAEDLYDYLSDPEVIKYEPYDIYTMKDCIAEAKYRSHDPSFLAIVLKESGKVIGNVYLSQIEPMKVNTYTIGYVLNRAYHRKGYGSEAVKLLIDDLFKKGAHRIFANCNTKNIASWKLLEKVGMRREAEFKKKMFFQLDEKDQPDWFDAYEYAILREEWQ